MQRIWQAFAVASAATLAGCSKGGEADKASMAAPMGGAEYAIVLKSTWTPATHPFEYPAAGALTGPHFSGIIGGAHSAAFHLFAAGTPPTPGLERLSEEGRHSPLDEEIRAAIAAGTVLNLVESGPLRDFADSLTFAVAVDSAHPLVSFVAMVAPSPDWFTGVNDVNLLENGSWVGTRTIPLYAWDSGGDDGTTYKAADRDTDPKKPASQAMTRHFVAGGTAVPVGSVTFTRR